VGWAGRRGPRSNVFQKAIYLAQKILVPGSTVTESAMLRDSITGLEREVDVLIEGQLPGLPAPIRIGIECRDQKAKQGAPWIESIHAKHEHLPIDVSIAASAAGFARTAEKVAEHYKIHLWEPTRLDEDVEREIVGVLEALWGKAVTFSTDDVQITEATLGDDRTPATSFIEPLSYNLLDDQGQAVGDIREMVRAILFSGDNMNNEGMRDALTGPHEIKGEFNEVTLIRDGSTTPVFTFPVSHPEQRLRVRSLAFVIAAQVTVAKIPLKHQLLNGTGLSYGEATVEGKAITVVAVEKRGLPPTVAFEPTRPH